MKTAVLAVLLLAVATGAEEGLSKEKAFALDIEKAICSGDEAFLRETIDMGGMFDQAVVNLGLKEELLVAMKRGFMKTSGEMPKQLSQRFTSCKLLSLRAQDGKARGLFRMLSEEGFTYQEMLLVEASDGRLKVGDIYPMATGEWLTATFRRGFLPIVAEQNKGLFEKLVGKESDFVKFSKRIAEMQKLGLAGKSNEALAVYAELPETVRKDKTVMIQRYAFAMKLGGEPLKQAVEEYRKEFPLEPNLDLISLGSLLTEKRYAEWLDAISRLEKAVGGDPYLDYQRSEVYYVMGEKGQSKDAACRAISREPALKEPYWILVTLALESREFAEVARILSVLEKDLGAELPDLAGVELYREFLASEDGRTWSQSRKP